MRNYKITLYVILSDCFVVAVKLGIYSLLVGICFCSYICRDASTPGFTCLCRYMSFSSTCSIICIFLMQGCHFKLRVGRVMVFLLCKRQFLSFMNCKNCSFLWLNPVLQCVFLPFNKSNFRWMGESSLAQTRSRDTPIVVIDCCLNSNVIHQVIFRY